MTVGAQLEVGFADMMKLWFLAFFSSCLALDRLSSDTYPLSYHLRITPNIRDSSYRGELSMKLVMKNTSSFELDCEDLNVTSSSFMLQGVVPLEHNITSSGGRLHVRTVILILESFDVTLNLTFSGSIRSDLVGFYRGSYIYNQTKRYLGSTHFEASGARKAFPCFDEPSFRADFTLEVNLEPGWMALSNTPALEDQTSGGVRRIRFTEKKSIPSYLVAWVIYEEESFTATRQSSGNVTYSIWSNRAYEDERTIASLTAPIVVEYMERFTGVDSTAVQNKMDLVGVPDFSAGAMENWGLITFRESMLLFNPEYSTAWDRQQIMMVVAHELAHQWFGNLVTPHWWSCVWLSEGFARYLQYFLLDQVIPELRLGEQFAVDRRQLALQEDSLDSHPLTNQNLTSQADIMDMFDVITYDKGASIIHMISSYLGPAFKTGIHTYLTKVQSAGGVTNPEHFFSSFPSLPEEMREWSETSAYPVLIASESNNTLTLSQIKITGWNSVNKSHWLIPVSVKMADNITWFRLQPKQKLHLPIPHNSSLFININQTGYFRVLYREPGRWLVPDVSPLERSQLLDDSLSLAYSGLVPWHQAMLVANFHLSADMDYLPWRTGLRHLARIRELLEGSDLQAQFTTQILEMMSPVMRFVAWNESESLSLPMKLHQLNVLKHACEFGHPDCLSAAQQIVYNISGSSPEKRSALLCTGVRRGNESSWDMVMRHYKQARSPAERQLMLASLACTLNTTHIQRLLEMLWTEGFKRQDIMSTITLISSTSVGAQQTLQYLNNNYINIYNYFGDARSIKAILSAATNKLNDSQLTQLKEVGEHIKSLTPQVELDSFIRKVERRRDSLKMTVAGLKAFLTGEESSDKPTGEGSSDKPTGEESSNKPAGEGSSDKPTPSMSSRITSQNLLLVLYTSLVICIY